MNYQQIIRKLYNLSEIENYGFSEADIAEAEKRLHISFPKSLRHYYLTLGKNKSINEPFNRLIPLNEIDFIDDKYLIFYEENQAVVLWGVNQPDLIKDNPSVYGSYNNEREEWFLDANTIEYFLLSMAYWNGALGGLTYCANTDISKELSKATISKIEQNWEEQVNITNQMLRFFTNDYSEILIFTTDYDKNVNGLYIGSNNEKKYKNIIEELDIQWSYRTDQDE